jgi:hypothetical protein
MRARWQPTAVSWKGKKRVRFEKIRLTFIIDIDVDSGYKSRVIEPRNT